MAVDGRRTGSTEGLGETCLAFFTVCLSVGESRRGPASERLFPSSPLTREAKLATCLHRGSYRAEGWEAEKKNNHQWIQFIPGKLPQVRGGERWAVGGGWREGEMCRTSMCWQRAWGVEGGGGRGRGTDWEKSKPALGFRWRSENMKMTAIRRTPGPNKWSANATELYGNLGCRCGLISRSLCSWNQL